MAEKGPEMYETEEQAWLVLPPQERFRQYCALLDFYFASGGSPAPEHDSQSPFDFPEYYKPVTADPFRRPGDPNV
jgi:hypothetical protein